LRLKAWLSLPEQDARTAAAAYDRACEALSEEDFTSIRDAESSAVMGDCTFEEFSRLSRIMPGKFSETAFPGICPGTMDQSPVLAVLAAYRAALGNSLT